MTLAHQLRTASEWANRSSDGLPHEHQSAETIRLLREAIAWRDRHINGLEDDLRKTAQMGQRHFVYVIEAGRDHRMAMMRADAVAERLVAEGVGVDIRSIFPHVEVLLTW